MSKRNVSLEEFYERMKKPKNQRKKNSSRKQTFKKVNSKTNLDSSASKVKSSFLKEDDEMKEDIEPASKINLSSLRKLTSLKKTLKDYESKKVTSKRDLGLLASKVKSSSLKEDDEIEEDLSLPNGLYNRSIYELHPFRGQTNRLRYYQNVRFIYKNKQTYEQIKTDYPIEKNLLKLTDEVVNEIIRNYDLNNVGINEDAFNNFAIINYKQFFAQLSKEPDNALNLRKLLGKKYETGEFKTLQEFANKNFMLDHPTILKNMYDEVAYPVSYMGLTRRGFNNLKGKDYLPQLLFEFLQDLDYNTVYDIGYKYKEVIESFMFNRTIKNLPIGLNTYFDLYKQLVDYKTSNLSDEYKILDNNDSLHFWAMTLYNLIKERKGKVSEAKTTYNNMIFECLGLRTYQIGEIDDKINVMDVEFLQTQSAKFAIELFIYLIMIVFFSKGLYEAYPILKEKLELSKTYSVEKIKKLYNLIQTNVISVMEYYKPEWVIDDVKGKIIDKLPKNNTVVEFLNTVEFENLSEFISEIKFNNFNKEYFKGIILRVENFSKFNEFIEKLFEYTYDSKKDYYVVSSFLGYARETLNLDEVIDRFINKAINENLDKINANFTIYKRIVFEKIKSFIITNNDGTTITINENTTDAQFLYYLVNADTNNINIERK